MNQPMAARTFPTTIVCMLALFFGFYVPLAVFGSEEIEILNAQRENDGVLVHSVKSPHQSGKTAIQVLLPDRMEQGKRYPVVYILPVESGDGTRWGDGLVVEITSCCLPMQMFRQLHSMLLTLFSFLP